MDGGEKLLVVEDGRGREGYAREGSEVERQKDGVKGRREGTRL